MKTDGCNSWMGHKWPKWSEPEQGELIPGTEDQCNVLQRRACERCGMVQYYAVTRLSAKSDALRSATNEALNGFAVEPGSC